MNRLQFTSIFLVLGLPLTLSACTAPTTENGEGVETDNGAESDENDGAEAVGTSTAALSKCGDLGTGFAWPWQFWSFRKCESFYTIATLPSGNAFGARVVREEKAVIDMLQGKNWIGWLRQNEHYRFAVQVNGRLTELGSERLVSFGGGAVAATPDEKTFVVVDRQVERIDVLREGKPEVTLETQPYANPSWGFVAPDAKTIATVVSSYDGTAIKLGYRYFDAKTLSPVTDKFEVNIAPNDGAPALDRFFDVAWTPGCDITATFFAPPAPEVPCDSVCFTRDASYALKSDGAASTQNNPACLPSAPWL